MWLASDEIRKMNVPLSGDLQVNWTGPSTFPWKLVWFSRGIIRQLDLPITTTFILLSIFPATLALLRRRKRLKAISPSPLSRICPGCSYEFPAQQPQCPECGVAAKSE
jgi:hypothetical protein